MELTTADLDTIRAENLHVRRDDFVRVWTAVEEHQDWQDAAGVLDWAGWGVVSTCRWLTRTISRPQSGAWYVAWAPVTGRDDMAYPELIQAECLAVDLLLMRQPAPRVLTARPGWAESIAATLDWAWRYSGRAPVFGEHRAAS